MKRHQFSGHFDGQGFTLVELMVVIAIAALLMVVAAPNLQGLLAAQRVKTASYEIVADLTMARSEALKRGQDVSLTPATGGWAAGWAVTTSVNTPTVAVIQISQQRPLGAGVTFTQSPGTLTFDLNGRLAGTTTVARFGLSDGGSNKRCISVDPSGRPKSVTTVCPS